MKRLIHIKPALENRLEHLKEWVTGFETGYIFLTALDLDIFSRLKTPLSAEELAALCGLHGDLTRRFLNVLTGMGLLHKKENRYGLMPETAPFLVKDSPYFARYLRPDEKHLSVFMRLKEILKQGPLNEIPSGQDQKPQFDRASMDWMARVSLLGRLQTTVKQVISLPEFPRAKKLIDLGGGHGLFGIAFAQENPDLRVVIFDRPEVIPATEDHILQYGAADRVSAMAGDYTRDDFGKDYDIIFEACSFGGNTSVMQNLLRKISSSLRDNGLFIHLTFTLDNDGKGPIEPLLWDLKNHLVSDPPWTLMTDEEIFRQLSGTGLKGEQIIDLSESASGPFRLMISRKMG
nr:methyltransferase [Desulfobacula sp.]